MRKDRKRYLFTLTLILILSFALISCGKASDEAVSVTDTENASGKEVDSTADDAETETDLIEEVDDPKDDEEVDVNAEKNDDIAEEADAVSGNPVADHGKLSVNGTQLVDANKKAYQLRGVSTHGIAWFPQYVNYDAFQTMKDEWGINCVRLAMYSGENYGYCTGGDQAKLKQLVNDGVDYATKLGLYVIVDWHVLGDQDPNVYKKEALAFFEEMSGKYADYENVIYEICNEPNGGTTWSQVKSYAEEVIPVIKKHDPGAVIIVGTPTWSQDVDIAAKDPVTGYDNIMYTIHFYADTHRDNIRQKMLAALDTGIPVFCSEFGICDASGAGANNIEEGNTWMKLLDEKGISYCAWNLSNKDEASSLIKSSCSKTSGWTEDDLSESGRWYYEVLRSHAEYIKSGEKTNNESGSTEKNKDSKDNKDTKDNKDNNRDNKDNNRDNKTDGDSSINDNDANKNNADSDNKQNNTDSVKSAESAQGDLKVSAKCSNQWSDGSKYFYQYDVIVKNTGSSSANGWSVQLEFDGSIKIDQSWNGEYSVSGSSITIKPVDYNREVGTGQSVDAGLIICSEKEVKLKSIK